MARTSIRRARTALERPLDGACRVRGHGHHSVAEALDDRPAPARHRRVAHRADGAQPVHRVGVTRLQRRRREADQVREQQRHRLGPCPRPDALDSPCQSPSAPSPTVRGTRARRLEGRHLVAEDLHVWCPLSTGVPEAVVAGKPRPYPSCRTQGRGYRRRETAAARTAFPCSSLAGAIASVVFGPHQDHQLLERLRLQGGVREHRRLALEAEPGDEDRLRASTCGSPARRGALRARTVAPPNGASRAR